MDELSRAFSPSRFNLSKKGVNIAYVTLNVGLGTFMPVKVEKVEDHTMHFESYSIPKRTADLINNKKGAVIAVGTTVLRCLEATIQKYGKIGRCNKYCFSSKTAAFS